MTNARSRDSSGDDRNGAASDDAKPKVPIEKWIPEMPRDSAEFLARRNGPWPKFGDQKARRPRRKS